MPEQCQQEFSDWKGPHEMSVVQQAHATDKGEDLSR